ncbi:hypothetical protein BGX26_002495 [Mortierella sp. AD094]|nr:hypothetical protein BGX26_002495 [Mortierella sp. AD094]
MATDDSDDNDAEYPPPELSRLRKKSRKIFPPFSLYKNCVAQVASTQQPHLFESNNSNAFESDSNRREFDSNSNGYESNDSINLIRIRMDMIRMIRLILYESTVTSKLHLAKESVQQQRQLEACFDLALVRIPHKSYQAVTVAKKMNSLGVGNQSSTIESTETIGDLKDLIKTKKASRFDDVAADELTLWRVSIPDDDDDDHPISLDSVLEKKRLKATTKLSKVLGAESPEDTIHIIIQ